MKPEWPPFTMTEMLALQRKYGSDAAIARAVGRNSKTVSSLRRRLAVTPGEERNPLPTTESVKGVDYATRPPKARVSDETMANLYDDRCYDDEAELPVTVRKPGEAMRGILG